VKLENRRSYRAVSPRAHVCDLRAERISTIHSSAFADKPGGFAVHYCKHCFALLSLLFAVQLAAGLLLLSGYFVPLALILLAAEIFNILAFHLTMAQTTIGPGLLAAVLWVTVFLQHRHSFTEVLSTKPVSQG